MLENTVVRAARGVRHPQTAVVVSALCAALVGCRDDGATAPPTAGPSTPDRAARTAAATTTATTNSACTAILPYYWEVGDKDGVLASASVGGTSVTATTSMPIASASKWIYGAYVAERRAGALTAEDTQFLTFRSGYTNFSFAGCDNLDTVAECVARSTNGVYSPNTVDKFLYDGGHMQKHASLASPAMNLGAMGNAALALEVRRVLGTDIGLTYTQPQLAGGIRSTAADYAVFLRKILSGRLQIANLLGTNATCTNPSTCATALGTPVDRTFSWSYSIGHWVENDPVVGDSAYSSAGAFGFYPWINKAKSLYGVIARVGSAGAGGASAECGIRIRKAWVTGVAQTL